MGPLGATGPQGPAGNSLLSDQFNRWQGQGALYTDSYDCTLGEIVLGVGWRGTPADGRLMNINQHQALYSILGTTFGGDGVTTFAVPNLTAVTPNGLKYSVCTNGIYPSRM